MNNAKAHSDPKRQPSPQPGNKSPKLSVPMLGGGSFDIHKRYGVDSSAYVALRGITFSIPAGQTGSHQLKYLA